MPIVTNHTLNTLGIHFGCSSGTDPLKWSDGNDDNHIILEPLASASVERCDQTVRLQVYPFTYTDDTLPDSYYTYSTNAATGGSPYGEQTQIVYSTVTSIDGTNTTNASIYYAYESLLKKYWYVPAIIVGLLVVAGVIGIVWRSTRSSVKTKKVSFTAKKKRSPKKKSPTSVTIQMSPK